MPVVGGETSARSESQRALERPCTAIYNLADENWVYRCQDAGDLSNMGRARVAIDRRGIPRFDRQRGTPRGYTYELRRIEISRAHAASAQTDRARRTEQPANLRKGDGIKSAQIPSFRLASSRSLSLYQRRPPCAKGPRENANYL